MLQGLVMTCRLAMCGPLPYLTLFMLGIADQRCNFEGLAQEQCRLFLLWCAVCGHVGG